MYYNTCCVIRFIANEPRIALSLHSLIMQLYNSWYPPWSVLQCYKNVILPSILKESYFYTIWQNQHHVVLSLRNAHNAINLKDKTHMQRVIVIKK